jgi:hypothetical protein
MSHDDELRSRLGRLAESHQLAEVSFDSIEARGDRRTRNRRVVLAASVLTLLLGTAGVLRLFDGDEAGDVDVASNAETPTSSLPASTTTLVPGVPPSADSTAGSSVAVPVPGYGGPDRIVPWGDGFLSLGEVFEPLDVTMQDLVPGIEGRFSPEIIAALVDADVTGIPEAIEVLREAGLLDEATAAVQNDPVLLEMYNRVDAGGTYRFEASISPDGENWTVLPDFALPGGSQNFGTVQSDGEHLLVVEQVWDSELGGRSELLVSSTTDLVNWTTSSLPIEFPDVPPYVTVDVGLLGATIGADGWYATANFSTWIDTWELFPEDLRAELENTDYGWSPSPEGLVIGSYPYEADVVAADGPTPPGPPPAQERTIPWDDLGVTYEDYASYEQGYDRFGQAWVGAWDGSIVAATAAVATACCQLTGTDSGFLAESWDGYEERTAEPDGARLFFSSDGQSWTEIPGPPGDGWFGGLVAVDGGVITTMSSDDGTQQIWRADPSGAGWQPVEIPGLPATASVWFGDTGARGIATVVDVATYDDPYEQVEYATTFEWDGFEIFTYNYADSSFDFKVTDLATQEIVVEYLGVVSDGPVPDFVSLVGGGVGILDEEGNEIVVVPIEEISAPAAAAQEAAREEAGWVEADYQSSSDFWLVASLDGTNWYVEDLPENDEGDYDGQVAINGTTVVVGGPQGWVTYDIG